MKNDTVKRLLKRYGAMIAATIVGAIAGYTYWHFAGCPDGTCPITSSPVTSTIWGALMGCILFIPNKSKNI